MKHSSYHTVTFCVALQNWIRGSRVLYTIHFYWHFMGSQVARCAPEEHPVDGVGISLWTVALLQLRTRVCHSAVDSHKVKRWRGSCLRVHLFCSRSGPNRQTELEEQGPSLTAAPLNVTEGHRVIAMETQPPSYLILISAGLLMRSPPRLAPDDWIFKVGKETRTDCRLVPVSPGISCVITGLETRSSWFLLPCFHGLS